MQQNFLFLFISGALTKSQFPVFTIYAQKSCLSVRPCSRAWCIDRVQNYRLAGFTKRSTAATSRQDCFEMCLGENEFTCRYVNCKLTYNYRLSMTCDCEWNALHWLSEEVQRDFFGSSLVIITIIIIIISFICPRLFGSTVKYMNTTIYLFSIVRVMWNVDM